MNPFFGVFHGVQGELVAGVARLTAGALIAGLWQGVLLSAAAALVLWVSPKSTAALRFVVWAAVFCASVALPFINMRGAEFVGGTDGRQVVFDLRWSYVLTGLWLVAAAYRLVELMLQGVALRALWKSAVPVAVHTLAGLEVPLQVGARRVELCTSKEIDRPSVIGFFAPRILVPAWLLEQLTTVELNHIVLHEMEHLRRRDDWVNLLQKIGLVLLPLNPALFWIDRRLSTERELACDDGVLERTKTPRAYAASLTSVAQRRLDSRKLRHTGVLALAATGLKRRSSELGQRIESILGLRTPVNRAMAGGVATVLVAGVVGSAAALARVPQLVTFGQSEAMQQAAVGPASARPVNVDRIASPMPADGRARPVAMNQNVSFREPVKAQPVEVKNMTAKAMPVAKMREVADDNTSKASVSTVGDSSRPGRKQLVVLTSWEDDTPVTRVIVQTPDGRFFLAPYAAVPTQAGWLLIQL